MKVSVIIMGPVIIGKVEGGTVRFGDGQNESPNDSSNSISGQGSENSGANVVVNNGPTRKTNRRNGC
jgi:Spore germination protein gerPA/gerPF